jgi:hypothetical protein
MSDKLHADSFLGAAMNAIGGVGDQGEIVGHYQIQCHDAEGNLLWEDGFDNLVTTVGQNQLLASGIYSTAYMGLISASGYGAGPVAGDTMASHSGWLECGGSVPPVYGTTRPTLTFSTPPSAGQITTTSTNSYTFTSSGTVEGAFIVLGSGASATVDSTTGVLLSAGALTTPQPVIATNTVTMSYTLTL